MMLQVCAAIIFTLGWVLIFLCRTEDATDAWPTLAPNERAVSYLCIITNSINMAIGCTLTTFIEISARAVIAGIVVYLLGIGLWFWARLQISPLSVRRMPHDPPLRFRRDGAFGWVRHPLYCGTLIASAAPLVVTRSWLVAVAYTSFIAAIITLLLQEERRLRQQVGPDYESYAREVSRLIPFIW